MLYPVVPESLRITSADLRAWAKADPAAAVDLPVLIRWLIAETCPTAALIDVPGGIAASRPGWDGIVHCASGNRFVPDGKSVWELSVQQGDANGKARRDYDKRITGTPAADRQSLAYVAVVCAAWRGARGFQADKSSLGEFRTVRALNASDLEAWLECAPVSTVWLRDRLGKPRGVELLASWWDRWSARTVPPLGDKIVLAGRAREAEMLRDRCAQTVGGVCSVGGDMTVAEVTAFVAAALGTEPEDVGARVLYTEDRSVLRQLINPGHVARTPPAARPASRLIVMVPSLDCAADVPADSPHLVIAASPGSSNAQIRVEPVDSEEVAERLRADGFDLNKAHRLGAVARMSLPALCRQLARQRDLLEPDWCKDTLVRRMILLGGWHSGHEGDKQALEQVTGRSYEELTERLYAIVGDPPLVLTGRRWHTASPADAWDQIKDRVTHEELGAFRNAALEVLVSPDPYQSMGSVQEFQARSQGVRTKHSESIRRGVATTLALLGTHPPQARGDLSPRRSEAAGVVAPVLRQASEDTTALTWLTLSDYVPLLAEAAPEALLAALRTCIGQQHPFAQHLLDAVADERVWHIAAPELLSVQSALATLGWAPDHFFAVVSIMAQLVPPEATDTATATRGLRSVLCPWLPQTLAGPDERLQALDRIRETRPQASWTVMLDMLDTSSARAEHPGPRYRDWKPSRHQVSSEELHSMRVSVAERLIEDARSNPTRLATLVRRMSNLPRQSLAGLREALEAVAQSDAPETAKDMLWSALRAAHAHHSAYPDTDWSLNESDLAEFEQLLEVIRPTAPANRHGWLFTESLVHIPEAHVEDRDAHEQALQARRTQAVADILASHGFPGVVELASAVRQPQEVGRALARTGTDQTDAVIEALSGSDPPGAPTVGATFGYLRDKITDWGSFQALIVGRGLSARTTADLLRAVPPAQRGWRRAADLGSDVEQVYWERADSYSLGFPDDPGELLEVSQGLRSAGRFDDAASTLHMGLHGTSCPSQVAEEILVCLKERSRERSRHEDVNSALYEYRLSCLMEALDQNKSHLGRETVAMVELDHYRELSYARDFDAPNLYWLISISPAFFVSLVKSKYGWEPEPAEVTPEQPIETRQIPPDTAWHVLHGWPTGAFCPGIDGTLDADMLEAWVQEARVDLTEAGLGDLGDLNIGEALAATPPDPDDDEAPSETVRKLIERLDSDAVDDGYDVAVSNRQGATSRGLTEGGTIERDLARKYRDISHRYRDSPRTAAIYAGLASSYEHMGEQVDEEAEARRRGQPR